MNSKVIAILAVVGAVLVYAFAGSLGQLLGKAGVNAYTTKSHERSNDGNLIDKIQAEAAANLRKQLPLQVDELTTLQTVLSAGPMLMYSYLLGMTYADIDHDFFSGEMPKILLFNVCGSPEMVNTMALGAVYKYTYLSRDGRLVGTFSIAKNDCPSS